MSIANSNSGVDMDLARTAIQNRVIELFDQHRDGIDLILSKSNEKKIRLNFASVIDISASQPTVRTSIGFGQMVKDVRDDVLGEPDPDQAKMDFDGSPLEERPGEGPVEAHKRRRNKDAREEQAEAGD